MSLSLLEYCRRNEIKLPEVARRAGVDPKWIYKVARGEAGFSLDTAAKIEMATGGLVKIEDMNKTRQEWLASPAGQHAIARQKKAREAAGRKKAGRPFADRASKATAA